MASKMREPNGKNRRRPIIGNYFYLDKDLHLVLHINRGKDLLTAWNYPRGKKATYNYSTVINRHELAWPTHLVCKMINRSHISVKKVLSEGLVRPPQYTYGLDENRNKYMYMWHEDNIMELHEYYASLHRGRPRKDGLPTNHDLPTPRELRAMLKGDSILYVKQGDEFVPTWRAKEI